LHGAFKNISPAFLYLHEQEMHISYMCLFREKIDFGFFTCSEFNGEKSFNVTENKVKVEYSFVWGVILYGEDRLARIYLFENMLNSLINYQQKDLNIFMSKFYCEEWEVSWR